MVGVNSGCMGVGGLAGAHPQTAASSVVVVAPGGQSAKTNTLAHRQKRSGVDEGRTEGEARGSQDFAI